MEAFAAEMPANTLPFPGVRVSPRIPELPGFSTVTQTGSQNRQPCTNFAPDWLRSHSWIVYPGSSNVREWAKVTQKKSNKQATDDSMKLLNCIALGRLLTGFHSGSADFRSQIED